MKRPAVLWTAATIGAIGLALPGVILYTNNPGVATYNLSGLLLGPLMWLVLYWLGRWLPLRLQWIGALLIAPLGGIAYLLWPNDLWWNYGALTAMPLVLLAVTRDERGEEPDPSYGTYADGPWGPP